MADLACLLWDVDGTLADTERDGHRIAFNMAFAEAGLKRLWDEEIYGKLLIVTGGKERIQYDIDLRGMPELSDEQIAKLHARKTEIYQDLIAKGALPLRPGVRRLLEEAEAEGILLGIATTTTPAALDALIEYSLGSDWFDRFAVRAAGDIVPRKKPAPDIYHYAIEELGVDPAETLALEDSAHGLRAAKAADLRCVVTVNDYTRNQKFTGADLVISEFGEPCRPAIQVLANPHNLTDMHHVTVRHLIELMK